MGDTINKGIKAHQDLIAAGKGTPVSAEVPTTPPSPMPMPVGTAGILGPVRGSFQPTQILATDFQKANSIGGQMRSPVFPISAQPSETTIKSTTNIVVGGSSSSAPIPVKSSLLLETNGVVNTNQEVLNLVAGSNIVLTQNNNGAVYVNAGSDTGITLLPEGTATSGQNYDSNALTFEASYWNGSQPTIDSWTIQLFPGSDPASSGSDLEVNHATLNGAGRFHINSDMLIGPPLSATSGQNANSFAWDVEGSYWDGSQTQFNIWEQVCATNPSSGDTDLRSSLFMYPLWTGTIGGSFTGDMRIGGTGVNSLQGDPVSTPYWILKAYPVSDGFTLTLEHTGLTANQTINFPNASDTLVVPSVAQTWSAAQTFSEIISSSSNPAQSEFIRLADGDGIAWRNAANSSDLYITTDGSDNLILHNFGGLNMNGKYIEDASTIGATTSIQLDPANNGPLLTIDTGRFGDQGLRVQTGVTNENSALTVMPNGTSNESTIRLYNASDPSNTGRFEIDLTGTTVTFEAGSFGTGSAPTILDCQLTFNAQSGYQANGTAGVSAGAFSSITSIQSTNGLVTTLTGTSDERLKADIKPFKRGLDSILALHPSVYRWSEEGQKKTGFSGEQEFSGFIAQDVQKAIPEAVSTEGEYLALSDRPIIAALVNAVKELAAQNAALMESVKQLQEPAD